MSSRSKVYIGPVSLQDRDEIIAMNNYSQDFHEPWVYPPKDVDTFTAYMDRLNAHISLGFYVRLAANQTLVGVINLNDVVMRSLKSAYLGFYGHRDYSGHGLMAQGVRQVITHAFDELGLHRLEANVQPGNEASRQLIKRVGFKQEGFSPKYLWINNGWKDHERWAILNEPEYC